MSSRYVTRMALEEQLAAVDSDPQAVAALRAWIRDVLVGDDVELDGPVEPLILAVVEKLDLASRNDADLREVARDLGRLLHDVQDHDVARNLVPLVRDRVNLTLVLRKVLSGTISHTGWLSYLAEHPWPAPVKEGLGALSDAGLKRLLDALLNEDYSTVAEALDPTR